MKYAKKSTGGRMAAAGKAATKKKKVYTNPYEDPNHPMNRERTGPSTLGPRPEKDSKTRKPKYKKGGMIGHNCLY